MLTQSNISKNIKSSKLKINNEKDYFNRGIDVILNGGKKKRKKTFHIILDKMICVFNKEIEIYFEFSLNLKEKK